MRRLIALLLVSLLFLGELLPVVAFAQTEAHVRITATSLNVRSGPGTDFEVLGSVKKGEVVVQLRESPGWVQIQLESGTIGWVSDKYVEVVETTPTPTPPTREPAATPPPPQQQQTPRQTSSSGGGGSAFGSVFKWSCLLGAVVMGGLAYNEKSKGDDAYDEYKSLVNAGKPQEADVKFLEAEDHDDTARTYVMVSGGLFVLWVAQQFVFKGGSSNYEAGTAPLTFDPLHQNVEARFVLARF
ncbi:MAG: SH3 domain-containing protein [Candidatus Eisenbacteria bacterium]|uniref:SH3 domain-containing protein n=1 Tax=Eiseniibacteriota bacterium TaxID=2212470 RepID=A0A956M1X7_UNCEI|nr:SH3 domain-containing protein [Candidatus Eisenbacteria bacterium]